MSLGNEEQKAVLSTVVALKGAILAANNLVPGIVPAFFLTAAIVIVVSLLSSTFMVAITILVVFFAAVFVYFKSNDYAQALLALVVGLLTSFTVNWTVGRFIAFLMAWVGLLTLIGLITSVKLAARAEAIYTFAAQFVAFDDKVAARKKLEEISKDRRVPALGPIERAEVVRLCAIRGLPLDVMVYALRGTAILSVTGDINYKATADLVASLYAVTHETQEQEWDRLLDEVYLAMHGSGASPDEFVAIFNTNRRIILSGRMDLPTYLARLREGILQGVPTEEMYEHMARRDLPT